MPSARPLPPRRKTRRAAFLLATFALSGLCTAALADGDALVIVNGQTITKSEVVDVLMDGYGLQVIQLMIVLKLAKAEAKARGINVTRDDVQREYGDAIKRIVAQSGIAEEDATEANKEKALEFVLARNGISKAEFLLGMERNAYLRPVVEADFHVDEPTLREEFARTHGEKVLVRHIQVSIHNPSLLNKVVSLLRNGMPFEDVARTYSENTETAPLGGRLAPFAFDDERHPAVFREAAFSLDVDGVSAPIRTDQFFHIIKLEQRIPPTDVRFEDVRDQVLADLRAREIPEQMGELAAALYRKANVKILDTELKLKYEQFLRNAAGGKP